MPAPVPANLPLRFAIPTPFPVGDVNAYYLPGRVPTLVDTGPRMPEAEAALRQALIDRPVGAVVVTHQHVDHAGLAPWLQRERGARVHVHSVEAPGLERWTIDAAAREADYEAGLLAAGVPPPERERMRYGGRKYDHWGEALRPDHQFRGGETLLLGDDEWKVVDAPGHTAGSFLLHAEGRGQTFSGDTLLEHITPNAVSVRASERGALIDYLATLKRLRERDWGLVLPGHGNPFTGARAVIDKGLLHAQRRQDRILRTIGATETTAWDLVGRLFPRLPHNEIFLAVSEILGHLEVLRKDSRLRVRRDAGTDHYRLNGQG